MKDRGERLRETAGEGCDVEAANQMWSGIPLLQAEGCQELELTGQWPLYVEESPCSVQEETLYKSVPLQLTNGCEMLLQKCMDTYCR